jgi:hypothetical protein
MARHRNSPHIAFWRMIKQGYDHFEVTHLEPKVDVCDKRYAFGAESTENFSPGGPCPAYEVPDAVAAAVVQKQSRDDFDTTQLIIRGIATVPITTGLDGGTNPIFLAPEIRKRAGAMIPPCGATPRAQDFRLPKTRHLRL